MQATAHSATEAQTAFDSQLHERDFLIQWFELVFLVVPPLAACEDRLTNICTALQLVEH